MKDDDEMTTLRFTTGYVGYSLVDVERVRMHYIRRSEVPDEVLEVMDGIHLDVDADRIEVPEWKLDVLMKRCGGCRFIVESVPLSDIPGDYDEIDKEQELDY